MSDPTDPGGVGAQAERGRTSTRVGDSGSPVGSPLTIVLALIAVVAGFLIFRSIDDSSANGSGLPDGNTTVPVDPNAPTTVLGATTTTATPPPTAAPSRTGATVVVINAAEVGGAAGAMTTELVDLGYTTEEGISDNDEDVLESTVVYFAGPGAPEAVARQLATDLGGVTVETAPSPVPIAEGDSSGAATVYVMLGTDLSGEELPIEGAGANVTAPAAAGTATTPG